MEFRHGKVGQDDVRLVFIEFPPKFDRSFYPVRVTAHPGALEFSHDELGVARVVLDHQDLELLVHGNLILHVNMPIKSIILHLDILCRVVISHGAYVGDRIACRVSSRRGRGDSEPYKDGQTIGIIADALREDLEQLPLTQEERAQEDRIRGV